MNFSDIKKFLGILVLFFPLISCTTVDSSKDQNGITIKLSKDQNEITIYYDYDEESEFKDEMRTVRAKRAKRESKAFRAAQYHCAKFVKEAKLNDVNFFTKPYYASYKCIH